MSTYVINFEVNGGGSFPLDMLRYDACYPTRSEDAARIEATLDGHETLDDKRQRQPIMLSHRGNDSRWQPTHERWRSFLWGVVDPQSVRAHKIEGSIR